MSIDAKCLTIYMHKTLERVRSRPLFLSISASWRLSIEQQMRSFYETTNAQLSHLKKPWLEFKIELPLVALWAAVGYIWIDGLFNATFANLMQLGLCEDSSTVASPKAGECLYSHTKLWCLKNLPQLNRYFCAWILHSRWLVTSDYT